MRFAVGADHAGFPLKQAVLEALAEEGHETLDLGTCNTDAVDYPDVATAVGGAVADGEADRGVILCGSGAGVAIAACKIDGVRASVVHDHYTAHQAVEHDDMNVICLGARVIGPAPAVEIVRVFAGAQYSGEERHARRLAKVMAIERAHGVPEGAPRGPIGEPTHDEGGQGR
jgi:ribose 5-phosphate isomerase B